MMERLINYSDKLAQSSFNCDRAAANVIRVYTTIPTTPEEEAAFDQRKREALAQLWGSMRISDSHVTVAPSSWGPIFKLGNLAATSLKPEYWPETLENLEWWDCYGGRGGGFIAGVDENGAPKFVPAEWMETRRKYYNGIRESYRRFFREDNWRRRMREAFGSGMNSIDDQKNLLQERQTLLEEGITDFGGEDSISQKPSKWSYNFKLLILAQKGIRSQYWRDQLIKDGQWWDYYGRRGGEGVDENGVPIPVPSQ